MRNDFNSFCTICALFAMLELSTFELSPEFQSKRHVFHFVCGIAHCSEMIWFVLVKLFFSGKAQKFTEITLAESFYYINYRLSIITSKVCQTISVMREITLKIVNFDVLIHILSWRQQKHLCLFSLLRLFDQLFDVLNNWQSIIDVCCRKTLLM